MLIRDELKSPPAGAAAGAVWAYAEEINTSNSWLRKDAVSTRLSSEKGKFLNQHRCDRPG
jgi:hypothetical protein